MFKIFSLASLLALALITPAFVAGCNMQESVGTSAEALTEPDSGVFSARTRVGERWCEPAQWHYEAGNKECWKQDCCDLKSGKTGSSPLDLVLINECFKILLAPACFFVLYYFLWYTLSRLITVSANFMDGRRNFSFYFGGEPVAVNDPGIADLKLTAKDRMHKKINEALDLPELEKTKLEKKILGDIFFAIKQACSKLGLKDFADAISFDMQNIHIISEEAYSTNLPPDSGGSNIWGEVYLIRTESGNNLHFVSSATHELAHYVSYREADIQQGVNSEQVLLRPKGVGYSNSPEGHAEQYVGLMEGVNEIFAHNVRQEFVKVNKNLSAKEKKLLINTRDAYSYLEYLILDLVYKLAKDESEYFELLDNLLRGHITGSHDFLKIAEDRMPGAIDILGGLGTSPQDTLVAAKKFGLTDAVQYVSDYIATKERELEKENLK